MRNKVDFGQRGMENIVCSALRPYGASKEWGGGCKDWDPFYLGAMTYSGLITLMPSVKQTGEASRKCDMHTEQEPSASGQLYAPHNRNELHA